MRDGPPLEVLIRRLEDCPPDFLAEPIVGAAGVVSVPAVVADLARDLGWEPSAAGLAAALEQGEAKERRRHLQLVLLASWLLHDPWFRSHQGLGEPAVRWITTGLRELARLVSPSQCVSDPERREELARLALAGLGLRPAGETDEQAEDRLTTLNSLERQRVIRASRAAEERSRAIRAALARKAAYEAADKMNRE